MEDPEKEAERAKSQLFIQLRVLNVYKKWIENYFDHFREDSELLDSLQKCLVSPGFTSFANFFLFYYFFSLQKFISVALNCVNLCLPIRPCWKFYLLVHHSDKKKKTKKKTKQIELDGLTEGSLKKWVENLQSAVELKLKQPNGMKKDFTYSTEQVFFFCFLLSIFKLHLSLMVFATRLSISFLLLLHSSRFFCKRHPNQRSLLPT